MASRSKIPSETRKLVLLECGYMCANPRCRTILALDLHHLVSVKDKGGNNFSNLLALCANCHDLHHRNVIPGSALRVWKGMLAALNVVNRANIDLLLQIHRMQTNAFLQSVSFSGDALLTLAPLFSADLVQLKSCASASREPASLMIGLTDRGAVLVDAWLAGDEAQYLAALSKTPMPCILGDCSATVRRERPRGKNQARRGSRDRPKNRRSDERVRRFAH